MTPRIAHDDVTAADWSAVVEDHLLDAYAALERATGDRVMAEQVEAEAFRVVTYWEVIGLELAFELGSRP